MPAPGGIRDDIDISRTRILLLIAILLGIAIRTYDLTEKSLWYKELLNRIRTKLALSEEKQFGSTHISVFRSPLS